MASPPLTSFIPNRNPRWAVKGTSGTTDQLLPASAAPPCTPLGSPLLWWCETRRRPTPRARRCPRRGGPPLPRLGGMVYLLDQLDWDDEQGGTEPDTHASSTVPAATTGYARRRAAMEVRWRARHVRSRRRPRCPTSGEEPYPILKIGRLRWPWGWNQSPRG